MTDWRDRLRGSGKRLTPQREQVLRAVDELGHATPDQVYDALGGEVNQSTVYRNLEVLEELGLIRHTHLSDRAPTYHSVGDHEHFHLVCRNCRTVISVDAGEAQDFVEKLRTEHGFTPDVGHLTMFGWCSDCHDGRTTEETR